jgi:putative PIN family toxin of toxin-antitoxin system
VRVVVDTNVLVSGLLSAKGAPAKIVDAILRGSVIPIVSEATFAELKDVLSRPKLQHRFRRAGVVVEAFLAELAAVVEFVTPDSSELPIRDPKDRPFIDLAGTRPAPDFIVTGDKDFDSDRYAGVPVISASTFAATALKQR